MKEKSLLELYKELSENYEPDFSRPSNYFKHHRDYLKQFQDGIANENNFFDNTMVLFEEVKKPKGEADFVSGSGSRYWYFKDGIIRGSNHWGNHVANCDWALKRKDGSTTYGSSCWATKNFTHELFGYAKWSDFVLKPQIFEIKDKEVLTTFNNKIGRDIIKIGKKKYQGIPTIIWKEVK